MTSAEDTLNKAIEESRGDVTDLSEFLDDVLKKGNSALLRPKLQVDEAQSFGANVGK